MGMTEGAAWMMLTGDLGCQGCGKFKGKRTEMPCDNYPNIEMDEDMGCPDKVEGTDPK